MILRRFMKHVTDQNWFAVGLDVIVVIVGIFLGLQVQVAYEDRGEREKGRYYIQKLHDEIVEAEPYAIFGVERIEHVLELLEKMLIPYRENRAFEPFSDLQCNAMIRSMVTTNFINPITTINELEQSGRSLIIRNDEIRQLIEEYRSVKTSTDRQTLMMLNMNAKLPMQYPTIIDNRGRGTGLEFASITGNTCHVENVEDNPGFGNDLVGNTNRYGAYTILMKTQLQVLQQLHRAIDEELNITHEAAEL